jgi:solute carrier family 25 phosphate transporter 3
MEDSRIKMVSEKRYQDKSLLSTLIDIAKENGILSSFNGLLAMLLKQVPYTIAKQMTFDYFTKLLHSSFVTYSTQYNYKISPNVIKWGISVLSAFITSIIACIMSQPGDMILTGMYHTNQNQTINTVDMVKQIYRQYGLKGFYIGLRARMLHVVSIITLQLVIYDIIKLLLGLPMTGHAGHAVDTANAKSDSTAIVTEALYVLESMKETINAIPTDETIINPEPM